MSILSTYIVPHPPLIIPEIGGGRESEISATVKAYDSAARRIAEEKPGTIVLISPHSVIYSDYIHISPGKWARGDFSAFGHGNISFEVGYDDVLAREITTSANAAGVPCGTQGEKNPSLDHGTMVPLHFINKYYTDYKLVRIGISGLYHSYLYKLGMSIRDASEKLGRKTVIVASGDLSHKLTHEGPYGYAEAGVRFDKMIVESMKNAAFLDFMTYDPQLCEDAAECGMRSFIIMSGAFDKTNVDTEFLSYEGPFGVGYAVCGYTPVGENAERAFLDRLEIIDYEKIVKIRAAQSNYAALAQRSVEAYFSGSADDISNELIADGMYEKAGVFVCLKKHGQLRGCIGTILPAQKNIANEIAVNAVSAATNDHRFDPVTEDELDELTYTVDVLTAPERCEKERLDPQMYGVIVTSGFKRGVLLPDLDGIDTVEKQLSTVLKKAGIGLNEKYALERFEVKRYS